MGDAASSTFGSLTFVDHPDVHCDSGRLLVAKELGSRTIDKGATFTLSHPKSHSGTGYRAVCGVVVVSSVPLAFVPQYPGCAEYRFSLRLVA